MKVLVIFILESWFVGCYFGEFIRSYVVRRIWILIEVVVNFLDHMAFRAKSGGEKRWGVVRASL